MNSRLPTWSQLEQAGVHFYQLLDAHEDMLRECLSWSQSPRDRRNLNACLRRLEKRWAEFAA